MSFYSSGMVYTMKINKIYTVLDGDKYNTKIKQKSATEVKGALQIHRMHKNIQVAACLVCSRNSNRPVWLDPSGRGEIVGHEF